MKKIILGGMIIILLFLVGYFIFRKNDMPKNEDKPLVMEETLNILVEQSEQMIQNQVLLQEKTRELVACETITDINHACLAVMRKDRYGYYMQGVEKLFWESFLGELPVAYIDFFASEEAVQSKLFQEIASMEVFIEPVNGFEIDYIHMLTVIDALYSDLDLLDHQEKYYDYLCGWGGDLLTFSADLVRYADLNAISKEDDLYQYAFQTIGSKVGSHFSEEDFLADIDGTNIAALMLQEDLLLSDALTKYYTTDLVNQRIQLFLQSFGGEETFKEIVNCFYYNKVEKEYRLNEDTIDFMDSLKNLKYLVMDVTAADIREANEIENKVIVRAYIDKVISY